ncbi:MAG TPA: hypothetical protein PLH72_03555 [Vicinamibacterales bacterium]|nr:hypothetical protein [Vicinamibacterales bacterium]
MPQYPTHLDVGSGRPAFERRTGLYAVRKPVAEAADRDAVAVIPEDAHASFAIYRTEHEAGRAVSPAAPVYAAGREGPLAVPTGRVFVRLAEGVGASEQRTQFASAGFEIEQTLSYAPNAAWLRPASGDIAQALQSLDTLRALAQVVHVEPQLLLQRALK